MQPEFRVRISPGDVGRRVTIRYRLREGGDGPRYSDVVGILRRWDAGTLSIENRRGETVSVEEADLVAGRVVRPPRTR